MFRTNSEEKKPEMTRSKKNSVPCKQYTKLNLPDEVGLSREKKVFVVVVEGETLFSEK